MKSNFIKISIIILVFCLFAACGSLGGKIGLGNKSRPFAIKKFDAAAWRAGDAQTRGEMSDDLHAKRDEQSSSSFLSGKSRQQILEILGEPDRKTRGKCCGGMQGKGVSDEEVWLYDLKVDDGTPLKTEHFQLYFHEKGVDTWRVAEWDEKDPDYFPRVG